MKKHSFLLLFSVLTSISLLAQSSKTKLIEKVVKKGNEIVIPYEKYQLENGLILLIHEDHSDPIVHVDVTYHVGSAREQEGRSGFAHFFEHMMFQGSEHVADEQHFKIVTEAGGVLNGTTNLDRTNYFETLPSNQLETALWLESDRMGFLLDSVTQKKFEVQRATVKNERGQNYDNKPYGLINEKLAAAVYPQGHPYSWPTIGYIEDLNRVDVNDLKKFFMRWYGPNNAVLTVAGDVKASDVVALVEKYFGSIPRGPEVKPMAKPLITIDKDRYISYEDKIRFPLLLIDFPTVPNRHPDEAPLDVLASIIGGGKNSLMYQNFVKKEKALQAQAANPCHELGGDFELSVVLFPGKPMAEAETELRNILTEFEKRGVKDEDLIKYKADFESNLIKNLSSVSGKASQLASNQTFAGDANFIQKEYKRYMGVTKEDVMRVYNTYIKNKHAVILSVYPKGMSDLVAKPDNFTPPSRNTGAAEAEEYKNLVYKKANDGFDRFKKPNAGPNPVIAVPEIWQETFANGLKVISSQSTEIPSVTLQLSIEAGHRFEKKEKSGLASITADLLNESTLKHSAEQMEEELEKIGSSIEISANSQEITITVTSLTKNIDATLKLMEEVLFQPKFDSEEFERSKKQQLEGIANQSTQPVVIANNVYNKLLYGNDHVMGIPVIGTPVTVASITLEDVKDYYNKNFSPSISQLVIVGDVSKETILPKLNFLKTWAAKKVERVLEPAYPQTDKTRLYLVNKENAPQSEIRIGYMALAYDATGDYYKSQILNHPLGGAFNSRINLNLREDKGYTYGARSGFFGNKFVGPYAASAGVKGDVTDSAIVEFIKEIKNYADNGITNEELSFTKNSMGQSDALKYETPAQKAGFLKRIVDYNLDKNYVSKQNDILQNITKTEVDVLAKKYLPYNKMNLLVVGDKAKLYDKLVKLGYDVIELDAEGNPVAKKDPNEMKKDIDTKKMKD